MTGNLATTTDSRRAAVRRTNVWGLRRAEEHDELPVETALLGVPGRRLAPLLEHYRAHPAARAELADGRGLERFREAAYDEVT